MERSHRNIKTHYFIVPMNLTLIIIIIIIIITIVIIIITIVVIVIAIAMVIVIVIATIVNNTIIIVYLANKKREFFKPL